MTITELLAIARMARDCEDFENILPYQDKVSPAVGVALLEFVKAWDDYEEAKAAGLLCSSADARMAEKRRALEEVT